MTVSNIIPKSGPEAGDNSNKTFSYTFDVLDVSHLVVIQTDAYGNEAVLTEDADYTVDLGTKQITLTATNAPTTDETITILRDLVVEQEKDFVFQAGYLPREQEDALDRLTMVQQSQAEQLSRAVKVPASSDATPDAFLQNHKNALLSNYAVKTINPALVIDPVRNIFIGDGTPTTLDTLLTHSRADTATFTDRNGILQTAAANELRADHHLLKDGMFQRAGLRVDPVSENLIETSEDYTTNKWQRHNCSITSSSVPAPDGTGTATEMTFNSTSGVRLENPHVVTEDGLLTFSVFLKEGTANTALLLFNSFNTNTARAWFNLTNGTVGTTDPNIETASIETFANGWHRCTATMAVFDAPDPSGALGIWGSNGDGLTTATSGEKMLVWGAQAEMSPIPTAYVKTSGLPVTRASETLTVPASAMPHTPNGFTFLLEADLDWLDGDQGQRFLLNWSKSSSTGDRVRLSCLASGGHVSTTIADLFTSTPGSAGASSSTLTTSFSPGLQAQVKMAVSIRPGMSIQLAVNGDARPTASATGDISSLNTGTLEIGQNWAASFNRLRIFDVALSETALVEATTL